MEAAKSLYVLAFGSSLLSFFCTHGAGFYSHTLDSIST